MTEFADEGQENELLPEEKLAQHMTSLGFSLRRTALDPNTKEYSKVYSDPNGRVCRAIAVIRNEIGSSEPIKFEYATITIQFVIKGTSDEVQTAPVFCREDLCAIANFFIESDSLQDPSAIDCAECGIAVAEFVTRKGRQICLDCARIEE